MPHEVLLGRSSVAPDKVSVIISSFSQDVSVPRTLEIQSLLLRQNDDLAIEWMSWMAMPIEKVSRMIARIEVLKDWGTWRLRIRIGKEKKKKRKKKRKKERSKEKNPLI